MKIQISNKTVLLLMAGVMLLFPACGGSADADHDGHSADAHAGEEHDAHEGHNHEAGSVEAVKEELAESQVLVTPQQMRSVNIETGQPSLEKLSDVIKTFGNIALPPASEASVSSFIGGVVTNIRVIEGDQVQKGQVLAYIEHPDVVALQQDYLKAKNQDKYLEQEYNRQSRLLRDSVNAARTFQRIEAEYNNNLAQLQSLKKKLEMINISADGVSPENMSSRYPLPAPVSGYVNAVMANRGVFVPAEKEVFHVADYRQVHLDLKVYEKDLPLIDEGQQLTFRPANNSGAGVMRGSVLKKSKRFDPESRTALVHAEITDRNDDLLPGMAVVAYIQNGNEAVWALPEEAIVAAEGKHFVFRVVEEIHEAEHFQETHEASEPHKGHEHAEDNGQKHSEEHDHGEEHNAEYVVFERIEVVTGVSEAGMTEVKLEDEHLQKAEFAVSNAEALMSEMKKAGAGGHEGHNH
ncbi:efflux RND transporter periplasmic adaptor subunit [Marinilabilia salmonicolor]|uniref:efflux RND transporter periplasmic adaptor subunit n=1 Tax=Marinilabilia salmonicolor TaxID=989 RepID=UPI00029AEDE9|nr:efflux RND transporter periplasmic adaptor subunit [Marinilabilia salmonicolor]